MLRTLSSRMRLKLLLLLLTAIALIVSVFFPWIWIETKNISITGWHTAGTRYGRPGLLSIIFTSIIILAALILRIWAHRLAVICSALNAGWSLRNFILISSCQGGECPARQPFFYVYVAASVLLLVLVLIHEVPQRIKPLKQAEANL